MQAECASRDLEKALKTTQGATDGQMGLKTGVGLNVLIEAEEEGLRLTTTDLRTTISCLIPAQVSETGAVSVAHALFHRVARTLIDPTTRLTGLNDRLAIRCGSIDAHLYGEPAQDFPPVQSELPETAAWCEMPAQELQHVIANAVISADVASRTNPHAANAEIRFGATGLEVTTSGGNRSTVVEVDADTGTGLEEHVAIVPAKSLVKAQAILYGRMGPARIQADAEHHRIHVTAGDDRFSSQMANTEGAYPERTDRDITADDSGTTYARLGRDRIHQAVSTSEAFAREGPEAAEIVIDPNQGTGVVTIKVQDEYLGVINDYLDALESAGCKTKVLLDTSHLREITKQSKGTAIDVLVPNTDAPVTFYAVSERMRVTHKAALIEQ